MIPITLFDKSGKHNITIPTIANNTYIIIDFTKIEYRKNPKAKDFLGKAEVVTEPCHKVCKWVKNNSYDKVVKYFSSKK